MTVIVKPESPIYDTAPEDLKPVLATLAEALADEPDWALRKESLLDVLMAVDGMTALSPEQQADLARVMEEVESGALDEAEAERTLADMDARREAEARSGAGADGDDATPPPDLLPMFIGAILERLDEPRIVCAEQAGFYLLSVQPEHVEAAETWLQQAPENMDALRALLDGDGAYATLFDLLLGTGDGDDGSEAVAEDVPSAANDDRPGGGGGA